MFSMTNTPDAQQMHKIANENVAVAEKDRLKPPLISSTVRKDHNLHLSWKDQK